MIRLMQLPSRSCTGCVYPEGVPAGRLRVLDLNSGFQERPKQDTHLHDASPSSSCDQPSDLPGQVEDSRQSYGCDDFSAFSPEPRHLSLQALSLHPSHLSICTRPYTPVSTHQDIYVIKPFSSALLSLLSLAWPAQPTWHFSQGSGLP